MNGRHPARTNANEQPSKGQSGRENLLVSTVDNHRLLYSWEASDQRRYLKHRSFMRCFSAFGAIGSFRLSHWLHRTTGIGPPSVMRRPTPRIRLIPRSETSSRCAPSPRASAVFVSAEYSPQLLPNFKMAASAWFPEQTPSVAAACLFLLNYLPACATGCSIRIAYQAADASHPNRAEQARRMQGCFADLSHTTWAGNGESSHRKGNT
jgi:hypothetical protein